VDVSDFPVRVVVVVVIVIVIVVVIVRMVVAVVGAGAVPGTLGRLPAHAHLVRPKGSGGLGSPL
jgi:hypothetical protein